MGQLHVSVGPHQDRWVEVGAPEGEVPCPSHHHLPSSRQCIRNMLLYLYVCVHVWVWGEFVGVCVGERGV